MNPGEAVKMDHEYKSFLAELGGGAPPLEAGAAHRGGTKLLAAKKGAIMEQRTRGRVGGHTRQLV